MGSGAGRLGFKQPCAPTSQHHASFSASALWRRTRRAQRLAARSYQRFVRILSMLPRIFLALTAPFLFSLGFSASARRTSLKHDLCLHEVLVQTGPPLKRAMRRRV